MLQRRVLSLVIYITTSLVRYFTTTFGDFKNLSFFQHISTKAKQRKSNESF